MRKFLNTKAKVVMALAVALAVALAIGSSVTGGVPGGNLVQTMLSPLRSGLQSLTQQAEKLYSYIFRYEALAAENEELRAQLAEMEDNARTSDALRRENERYKEALNLVQEHEDYKLVSAYIITWDSNNWSSSFTIAKGSSSGIAENMVAVTAQGQVVGLVTEVGSNWATVTTVLDSSLEISAFISTTGYAGMVQGAYTTGEEGMLRMDYLPSDAVIRNGDQVVTTGSTVYPRSLILGYVADADFDDAGVSKYAILTPAADFGDLEQVFIITEYVNE